MAQNYRRNPGGSNTTGTGNDGRAFLTALTVSESHSPGRKGNASAGSLSAKGSTKPGASSIKVFAIVMLSHAEKAL